MKYVRANASNHGPSATQPLNGADEDPRSDHYLSVLARLHIVCWNARRHLAQTMSVLVFNFIHGIPSGELHYTLFREAAGFRLASTGRTSLSRRGEHVQELISHRFSLEDFIIQECTNARSHASFEASLSKSPQEKARIAWLNSTISKVEDFKGQYETTR